MATEATAAQATATEQQLAAGRAYQRMLLDALGSDDPAEVQAVGPRDARSLASESGPLLRVRPEPREWSVLLCLAHLADAELVMAGRYRWVVAHDRPSLLGYDQDLWVDNLHTDDDDPEDLLRQYTILREGNIGLWRATTSEQHERVSVHGERGEESYDLMFRMLAGHDRVHLAQARRALAAVRG